MDDGFCKEDDDNEEVLDPAEGLEPLMAMSPGAGDSIARRSWSSSGSSTNCKEAQSLDKLRSPEQSSSLLLSLLSTCGSSSLLHTAVVKVIEVDCLCGGAVVVNDSHDLAYWSGWSGLHTDGDAGGGCGEGQGSEAQLLREGALLLWREAELRPSLLVPPIGKQHHHNESATFQ